MSSLWHIWSIRIESWFCSLLSEILKMQIICQKLINFHNFYELTIEFPSPFVAGEEFEPRLKAEWGCCIPAAMELMLPMYIEECDMNWDDIGAICEKAGELAWGHNELSQHWPGDNIRSSVRRRSIHCPFPCPCPSGHPGQSWRSPPSPPSSSWTWRKASGSWSGSRPSSWSGAAQPEIRDSLVVTVTEVRRVITNTGR